METKELLHLRLLGNPDNIPEDKGDGKQFWDLIKSFAFKDSVLVLIISSIPRKDVADMKDEECRSHLAKLQALNNLFDTPNLFTDYKKAKEEIPPNPGSDLDGGQDPPKETLTED